MSSLFLLRLWWEEEKPPPDANPSIDEGEGSRLHGRLLHVTTGRACNFDNWADLADLVHGMLLPPTQQVSITAPIPTQQPSDGAYEEQQ